MRFAFVCDDLSGHGNGTSVTAYRYAEALRRQGHEVRMVGVGASGPNAFPVPEKQLPLVTNISHSCGFRFAEPSRQVFDAAFDGVDLIHLFLPFELEQAALDWARRHHVPVSAAFHLQPENVTYNARIGSAPIVCHELYGHWRKVLYDRVRHVHCPSGMIAHELQRHGYRAQTHVISNGVPSGFHAGPEPAPLFDADGRVHVLSVGRLGREKDQATIIRAIARSPYKDRISLHLAGKGYMKNRLMALADELGVSMSIGYYDPASLAELMRCCPLTVHASVADIEAISVIECFASGSVPIIARSRKSAPSAFAIGTHCLFGAHDADGLARCIDWWIDHPKAVGPTRDLYLEKAEDLRVDICAGKFAMMAEQAVRDDLAAYERQAGALRLRGFMDRYFGEPAFAPAPVPAVAAATAHSR